MRRVTDTELALLRQLWERGRLTIRELTEALYSARTDSQYATVQKLLDRLESKQLVVRDRERRAHRFEAVVTREDFLNSQLQDLADKLCGGSLSPLLTTLVEENRFSDSDRASLRALVEGANPKPER